MDIVDNVVQQFGPGQRGKHTNRNHAVIFSMRTSEYVMVGVNILQSSGRVGAVSYYRMISIEYFDISIPHFCAFMMTFTITRPHSP